MLLATVHSLAAAGILLGVALIAVALMILAFRYQRSRGRWSQGGDAESNGRPRGGPPHD